MKRIGIGLLHLAVIGMAAGSFMGESLAGHRYWAAVKADELSPPGEAYSFAGNPSLQDIWDEETSESNLRPERWAVWRHRWGGLSLATCLLASILWRTLRTEAAGISLLLSASLALLSVVMWYTLG